MSVVNVLEESCRRPTHRRRYVTTGKALLHHKEETTAKGEAARGYDTHKARPMREIP